MGRIDQKSADGRRAPELGAPINSILIEQKNYKMPPREGISIAHFLTVADINRSARVSPP